MWITAQYEPIQDFSDFIASHPIQISPHCTHNSSPSISLHRNNSFYIDQSNAQDQRFIRVPYIAAGLHLVMHAQQSLQDALSPRSNADGPPRTRSDNNNILKSTLFPQMLKTFFFWFFFV